VVSSQSRRPGRVLIPHFLKPGEILFLSLLPGWVAAAIIIFYVGLAYIGLLYFAYRRKYSLPRNFHLLCLIFAFSIFISASLYSLPVQHRLPTSVFSSFAFLTCLIGATLGLAAVDLFFTDYYLATVRQVYISPPVRKLIRLTAFSVAVLVSMDVVFNFNPSTKLASVGVGGLALGLALQDTLKGVVAGLALGRLLRVGDWVRIKGMDGLVIDLDWGRLTLLTTEGDRIYIPNKELQQSDFLNYSRGQKAHQAKLEVGVSYSADPESVKAALVQVAIESPGVLGKPSPEASVLAFGDSSLQYGVFFWIDDFGHMRQVIDGVASRVWRTFREKGFEIPYPTRAIYMKQEGEN
jgi:MscS family membrane protein